jgi:alpha-tubulin suppressor-like RCC1 family protein
MKAPLLSLFAFVVLTSQGLNCSGRAAAGGSGGAAGSVALCQGGSCPPLCAEQVSASDYHACAAKHDGTLWCWGRNDYGQVGDGTAADRSSPVQVATLGTNVARVAEPGPTRTPEAACRSLLLR